MKRITEPNTIFKWQGELVITRGYGEGKTIHMQPVDAKPCEHCGVMKEYSVLEHSPLFQQYAEAVDTLIED